MVVEKKKFRMATSVPSSKVAAGSIAGAITTLIIFVLNSYFLPETQQLTGEVSAALTTIIAAVIAYSVPPSERDNIVTIDAS